MKATEVTEPGYYWLESDNGHRSIVLAILWGERFYIQILSSARLPADVPGEFYGPIRFEETCGR